MTIETINLQRPKQESCRVMICQFSAGNFAWEEECELHFLPGNDNIWSLLRTARDHSVEMVIFPELSVAGTAYKGSLMQWKTLTTDRKYLVFNLIDFFRDWHFPVTALDVNSRCYDREKEC
ncbi:MAG: hypothetical protein JWR05_439 [Mucilaginibacter sp.]|nr:hypothetical protein [Mucilaginibacter sp.]